MTRHRSLRSQSYRAARDLGNVQAASRGPGSYAKRVARRKVYAKSMGVTRRLTRGMGLK